MRFLGAIILFFNTSCYAINLDSLNKAISGISPSERMQVLKSELEVQANQDSNSFYSLSTYCESGSLDKDLRQALVGYIVIYEAKWNVNHNYYDKALKVLQEHEKFLEHRSRLEHTMMNLIQADAYLNLGSISEGLAHALEALDGAQAGDHSVLKTEALTIIGQCYRRNRNYPKALTYFEKGLIAAGDKVLVHCHEGRSRSAFITTLTLAQYPPFVALMESIRARQMGM